MKASCAPNDGQETKPGTRKGPVATLQSAWESTAILDCPSDSLPSWFSPHFFLFQEKAQADFAQDTSPNITGPTFSEIQHFSRIKIWVVSRRGS